MLDTTGKTVWVAVSISSREPPAEAIVAVGDTEEAAREALNLLISERYEDADDEEMQELRKLWVDEPPKMQPVWAKAK
jgi:hypothetical protein